MTEREELRHRGSELGLSFAKNANIDKMKEAIAAREAEDIIEDDETLDIDQDDEQNFSPDARLYEETNANIAAVVALDQKVIIEKLEREYEAKLSSKVAEIMANVERNNTGQAIGVNINTGMAKVAKVNEAMKLIRCVITCRNPLKQSWDGEIINVSNDVVGSTTKFVPFNLSEGFHLPQMIINTLGDKECTIFVNKKVNGENVKQGKLIKEFAIEILPPLTKEELKALSLDQKARGAIDDD